MIVNMISLRMDSSGNQISSMPPFRIRAHKEPILPGRFEKVCDDAWQYAFRPDPRAAYPLRLTTWTVTQP